jgi:uncharacterized LabA/DUF88 family protein
MNTIDNIKQGATIASMYIKPNNYAFIDGSNLHITYEYIDWKMDYKKLYHFLTKRFNVIVAYYFVGYALKYSDIYKKLKEYGYTLMHQITTRDANGKLIGNLDEYMIKQAKWDIDKYDGAIIISSDQHFAELVELLDSKDKLRLVLAPCNKGCSPILKKAANTKIEFLDNYRKHLEKLD